MLKISLGWAFELTAFTRTINSPKQHPSEETISFSLLKKEGNLKKQPPGAAPASLPKLTAKSRKQKEVKR